MHLPVVNVALYKCDAVSDLFECFDAAAAA